MHGDCMKEQSLEDFCEDCGLHWDDCCCDPEDDAYWDDDWDDEFPDSWPPEIEY
jgi:hypothetical protein